MRIAIDVSPLSKGHFLQHRVRGTGFYIENLRKALLKYYSQYEYSFYRRGESLPSGVDVVHIPYFEPFFLSLPINKKFKTIVTVHDLTPLVFPKYFPKGIKGELKWQIQKMVLKNADAIITDSERSKKDIIKYTGISEAKVNVIYLAAGEEFKIIQNSKFNPSASLRARVQSFKEKYKVTEKFVLYVGDVTWNKNLPRLLEAIKKINVPLIMVGKALVDDNFDKNNPWNQDLVKVQKMIEENKNIRCLGFIPTEDLAILYNLATVFAMSSLYEGFGLPLLEAMSCGCPVITSKEGSIPEIAGDAAYYIDAYSSESIANGIGEVFNSDNLKVSFAKKGLERVKNFTWRKTADETMRIYKYVTK